MGDHTESVRVDFDPAVISYETLLKHFWEGHDPTASSSYRQYMSAVFYHDDEQRRLAESSRSALAAGRSDEIRSRILPVKAFYSAEDYHQKYYLRQYRELMAEFARMYPRTEDFVNSTAAARINGYIGGFGTRSQLEAEIGSFALSERARKALMMRFKRFS